MLFDYLSHCLTPQQLLSLSPIKPIINDINAYISGDEHKHAQWKALQFIAPDVSHEELAAGCVYVSVFRKHKPLHTIFILG